MNLGALITALFRFRLNSLECIKRLIFSVYKQGKLDQQYKDLSAAFLQQEGIPADQTSSLVESTNWGHHQLSTVKQL